VVKLILNHSRVLLKRTHLNSSISQVHDDSTLRTEPSVQVRNTRNAVAFLDNCTCASLHQMLRHVALEVRQQLHLLFQLGRIVGDGEVGFLSFLINKVDVSKNEVNDRLALAKLKKKNKFVTHIPLDNIINFVVSLNMTPIPSSHN